MPRRTSARHAEEDLGAPCLGEPLTADRQEMTKAPAAVEAIGAFEEMVGGDLLSHTVSHAVPSALESLASEFGMGSGGPFPLKPPTKVVPVFDR